MPEIIPPYPITFKYMYIMQLLAYTNYPIFVKPMKLPHFRRDDFQIDRFIPHLIDPLFCLLNF